ncbi:MAG: LapA family protein [Xenococcaceae cyanobacterium]
MFLIAFRIVIVLALAYLFGLLVAWLVSFFNASDDGGCDKRDSEPTPTLPPNLGETSKGKIPKKRLVEVDESYYLEEFDLSKKK